VISTCSGRGVAESCQRHWGVSGRACRRAARSPGL